MSSEQRKRGLFQPGRGVSSKLEEESLPAWKKGLFQPGRRVSSSLEEESLLAWKK
jgi:hypothetical protein